MLSICLLLHKLNIFLDYHYHSLDNLHLLRKNPPSIYYTGPLMRNIINKD